MCIVDFADSISSWNTHRTSYLKGWDTIVNRAEIAL